MSIRARVVKGQLVLEEPVALPEGTVLDLVIDDEEDGLDDEERALLHSHIGASADQMKGKQGRPIVDVLADLRTGR